MSASFDVRAAWSLDERVALRPESFGALAYHFGTRRLSFLKHPQLVRVVEALAAHDTAEDAMHAVGVAPRNRTVLARALAVLADSGMIVPRRTA